MELNILLLTSVTIVLVTEFILRDIPELFPKASRLADIVVRLALSYIASYIFYVVVVHLKAERDKKNVSAYVLQGVGRILTNVTNLARTILENGGHDPAELNNLTRLNLLDALKKFGPNSQVTFPAYYIGIDNPTWAQYLKYDKTSCLGAIAELFQKAHLLDTQLIAILGKLRHCNLFTTIDFAVHPGFRNTDFETMASMFVQYFDICVELRKYTESALLPFTDPKTGEHYRGLVPFRLEEG